MITPQLADLCDDDESRLDSNKNKYRNLSAGWGWEVTSFKSTAGSWRLTAQHSSASHVHQPHPACPSVLLTWPTRRQCWWLMVPWKTENHSSQWHNQQSHSSHFATSLSRCRRHFSSLLLKPVLMMMMRRRSNHDHNYSHTAARGWGATFYTFKWSRDIKKSPDKDNTEIFHSS